ncbi:polyketide synthase [Colletotrichum musicola]|uniref:Polyketide synthase n=1 Tax=Colletotrichum musicola TaxID=2175873 RepID=A0A8H6U889_9PEZI|nr:polyketide synthase [Colletotrichum musicola]
MDWGGQTSVNSFISSANVSATGFLSDLPVAGPRVLEPSAAPTTTKIAYLVVGLVNTAGSLRRQIVNDPSYVR